MLAEDERREVLGAAVVAWVLMLVALNAVAYLPTHDGPHHIFLGYLENHIGDAARGYDQFYEHAPQVTSMGFNVVYSLTESFVSWRAAVMVTLSIIASVWGWGFFALCQALAPQRSALGILGFVCALQWALYMGFFSFVFSCGIGFFTLALAVRRNAWTGVDRLAIGALLLVQGIVHLFPAQLVGLSLVLIVLLRHRKRLLVELGLLALMGLPALCVMALTVSGHDTDLSASKVFSLVDRLRLLAAAFATGPLWRSVPVVGLALFGAVAAVRGVPRGENTSLHKALGLAALTLLGVALVAPFHLKAWEFFSARFIPYGVMLGIATVPLEVLSRKRRRIALGALTAFAVACSLWARGHHLDLERRTQTALAGLDADLTRSGPRLALVLDPFADADLSAGRKTWREAAVPFVTPLFNLGPLYAVAHGGIPSWSFKSRPELLPFIMTDEGTRAYPPVHDPIAIYDPRTIGVPASRAALLDFLAVLGARYEDVILYGSPEDGDALLARGYATDVREAGLLVAHFQGCPVSIQVLADRPPDVDIIVQFGTDPPQAPAAEFVIPAGTAPSDGGFTVKPRTAMCGPVWYRVAADNDRSRTPTFGDTHCANAGREGRNTTTGSPKGQTIRCKLAP